MFDNLKIDNSLPIEQFLDAYQKLAHKTSGFEEGTWYEYHKTYMVQPTKKETSGKHLLMCTLGIIGEYIEFLKSLTTTISLTDPGDTFIDERFETAKYNTMLEIGDTIWYISEMCTWANIKLSEVFSAASTSKNATIYTIGDLAETVKKYMFHDKAHGFKPMNFLPLFFAEILEVLMELEIPLHKVLQENITKLAKRHVEKFNGLANLNIIDSGCI